MKHILICDGALFLYKSSIVDLRVGYKYASATSQILLYKMAHSSKDQYNDS